MLSTIFDMNKFGNMVILSAEPVLLSLQILHFSSHTKTCTTSRAQSKEYYITVIFTDNSRIKGDQYDFHVTLWRPEFGDISSISRKFVDPHIK